MTRRCLARIAERDPELHAFITVTTELALQQAALATAELRAGRDRGPLHGIPIAVKDLIDVAGVRTTGGSAAPDDAVADEDAEVVGRLREAGAVILGKLNLHELAYGASGCVGHFAPTRNPRDVAHIAGGSSSGSAAAVAAGLCVAALGSDTSGSIRIPAALCGVVGLKPTFGLVSVRGVFPLSASYDHVGPMTRTVRDAGLVLRAIAGVELDDEPSPAPPRIGVPRAHFFEALDGEVAAAVERAIAVAAGRGAAVREVRLPVDDDRTVFRAESYAVHRAWSEERPDRYQPETLRRIRSGATVTVAEHAEKLHELARLREGAAAIFADAHVEVLVTPTVAVPAPSFAELAAHPDGLRARELVLMRNTRMFNILGTPAITLPCGVTSSGLPIGLQLAAAPGQDAALLRAAAWLERSAAGLGRAVD